MSMSSERWFNRNSFDMNYDMAVKILKRFNIEDYHFVNDSYGNLALIITKNLKKYKLEIHQTDYFDKDFKRMETSSCMIIYRFKVHRSAQKHFKEYMEEKKRILEDCIYVGIRWVANNSKL